MYVCLPDVYHILFDTCPYSGFKFAEMEMSEPAVMSCYVLN
jgi:hypothetical protein